MPLSRKKLITILSIFIIPFLNIASAAIPSIKIIKIKAYTDKANIGLFNTPITTYKEDIYVAFVNKPTNDKYSTIIGKWTKDNGWSYTTIETHTLNDPYHAQPSLAIDKQGYIHITYNMHSSPWQYSISKKPENITEWIFQGQALNGPHNIIKSSIISGPGNALIPGNRITYQNFAKDNMGDLYINYREALKNDIKVSYGQKQWSLGVSRYSTATKKWKRVGDTKNNQPFATEPGYRAQVGYITFDIYNQMHIVWNWHVEYSLGPGNKMNIISYARSDKDQKYFYKSDKTKLDLPIGRKKSDKIIDLDHYWSYTKVETDNTGTPYVLIIPKKLSTKKRSLIYFKNNKWEGPINMPYGATNYYIDKDNIIVAISSGLRVHRSMSNGKYWSTTELLNESNKHTNTKQHHLWLDREYNKKNNQLRFLAQNLTDNSLSIYTVAF